MQFFRGTPLWIALWLPLGLAGCAGFGESDTIAPLLPPAAVKSSISLERPTTSRSSNQALYRPARSRIDLALTESLLPAHPMTALPVVERTPLELQAAEVVAAPPPSADPPAPAAIEEPAAPFAPVSPALATAQVAVVPLVSQPVLPATEPLRLATLAPAATETAAPVETVAPAETTTLVTAPRRAAPKMSRREKRLAARAAAHSTSAAEHAPAAATVSAPPATETVPPAVETVASPTPAPTAALPAPAAAAVQPSVAEAAVAAEVTPEVAAEFPRPTEPQATVTPPPAAPVTAIAAAQPAPVEIPVIAPAAPVTRAEQTVATEAVSVAVAPAAVIAAEAVVPADMPTASPPVAPPHLASVVASAPAVQATSIASVETVPVPSPPAAINEPLVAATAASQTFKLTDWEVTLLGVAYPGKQLSSLGARDADASGEWMVVFVEFRNTSDLPQWLHDYAFQLHASGGGCDQSSGCYYPISGLTESRFLYQQVRSLTILNNGAPNYDRVPFAAGAVLRTALVYDIPLTARARRFGLIDQLPLKNWLPLPANPAAH